jgi:hypothetical protein
VRAQFDLRTATEPPNGLNQSLDSLAALLKAQGFFDGVVAFSQGSGTIIGAMMVSLLQGGNTRRKAFESAAQLNTIDAFKYPGSFSDVGTRQGSRLVFYGGRHFVPVEEGNVEVAARFVEGCLRVGNTEWATDTLAPAVLLS